MFRFTGKVTYADGTEAEFESGNAALAAYEKYAARHGLPTGKDSPPTLSSLVIAHHALGIREGVDAWMETVEGIELDAADPANPTAPEPSTG